MIADFRSGDPIMANHTPSAAIVAGTVLVVGIEVRIAHNDIAANTLGALACGDGLYMVDKDASTIADGAILYWDDTAKKVTTTVGSNKKFGTAKAAAATGVAKVYAQHVSNNT